MAIKTVNPNSVNFVSPNIWAAPTVKVTGSASATTAKLAPDRTRPTTPTNLAVVAASNAQANLSWGASTDPVVPGEVTSGVKGYRIFRNSSKIAQINAGLLTYSATGLTPGNAYNFAVASFDFKNNQSPLTSQVRIVMAGPTLDPDTTAPSVPLNPLATTQGETQINLAWSASTDPSVAGQTQSGLAGYKVYRDTVLIATLGLVTTYPNTGLTAGTSYSYRVSAIDVAGNESAQSAASVATTTSPGLNPDITPPSVPAGLAAAAQSTSSIQLTWSASTDPNIGGAETSGLAGYKIRRGGSLIATVGLVTTHLDSGLTAGTQYSYTIASVDAAGNTSAQSAAVLETTNPAPVYSLNVAWTPATLNDNGTPIGTILSHNIYASLTAGEPYEVVQNVPWTGTPSAVLILPTAGTWYVVVKTVTADGESVASVEQSRAANVS